MYIVFFLDLRRYKCYARNYFSSKKLIKKLPGTQIKSSKEKHVIVKEDLSFKNIRFPCLEVIIMNKMVLKISQRLIN